MHRFIKHIINETKKGNIEWSISFGSPTATVNGESLVCKDGRLHAKGIIWYAPGLTQAIAKHQQNCYNKVGDELAEKFGVKKSEPSYDFELLGWKVGCGALIIMLFIQAFGWLGLIFGATIMGAAYIIYDKFEWRIK